MSKPYIAFILTALLVVSAFFAWHHKTPPKHTASLLPDFSLPDTSGTLHAITDWQGKILIINFWATWCPPCLREIPAFIELQSEYTEQNIQFIGIAIDDPQLVDDYLNFMNVNYPILIDNSEGESLSQQLGNTINAIPYTVLVDPQGQIIFQHSGELNKQRLLELIEPLLTTQSMLAS